MNIESRLQHIERQLGITDANEIVSIDLGDGPAVQMTQREWNELMGDVAGTRLLPKE